MISPSLERETLRQVRQAVNQSKRVPKPCFGQFSGGDPSTGGDMAAHVKVEQLGPTRAGVRGRKMDAEAMTAALKNMRCDRHLGRACGGEQDRKRTRLNSSH